MLLFLCAISSCAGTADSSLGFHSRLWQIDEGLPNNVVQAVTQGADGYLWVGTRGGLARFDGVKFSAVILALEKPRPSITALCAGGDGSLWVGTERDGLYHLAFGAVSHYGKTDGLAGDAISAVKEIPGGGLWIGCREGFGRLQKGKAETLSDPSHLTNSVLSFCLDTEGNAWVGANRGIEHFLGGQKESSVSVLNNHPLRAIRSLFCDVEDTLWIGGGDGLTLLKDGAVSYFPKGEGPTAIVTAILRDRAGNVWVGTQGGLSRFVNGKFREEPPEEQTSCGIHALFEDREGSLWVGSAEGLVRLTAKSFLTYTRQSGLTQNAISSVCAGRDGSIWVGTWGGGLDQLKDGGITAYDKSNGLSSDFVVALAEARDGALWESWAYGHGTHGLDWLKSGRITSNNLAAERIGPAVTVLCEDQQGTMWAGSRNGLGYFKQGRFNSCAGQSGFANGPVNALCASRDGSLWIGTERGLARWRNGHFEEITGLTAFILSLYEDSDGELWIGTQGEGLAHLVNRTIHTYSTVQGLPGDSIYSILEDARHNLWLNGSKGVFRVGKDQFAALSNGGVSSLNCIGYGKPDGIPGSGEWQEATQQTQPAQPAACRGTDGRFWFRTSEGVAVTDPDKIKSNKLPPPVVIEEVVADGKSMRPQKLLEVPPGRGELEIHYTALSLRAPEKNRFRYRLEGSDPNWVDADGRRVAYYNHLAPGGYSFRVIACNNDGVWNETGVVLALKLQPHLWQTGWFLALCGVTAAASIGAAVRYFTRRKMQWKLERLQQQHAIEKERARIARDMHDELGAKLTHISFQGAVAARYLSDPQKAGEEIAKMSQTARTLVTSLDEIVWAVDPGKDSLENLAGYICRYAGDFFENSAISCEFVIPDKLPSCRLASDVRHHVFLAVKETLTNVLKHSKAAHVQIRLAMRAGQLDIIIADDGCGYDPAAAGQNGRNGHGLGNLHERLRAVHGSCQTETHVGKGTRVKFKIPLPEQME